MKKLVFLHILFLFSAMCIAQEDKKSIIKGNEAFDSGDFSTAEEAYRSAEESERMRDIARFNLGDALYRQGKFEEAADAFGQVAEESADESLRSRAYHNLGNSMLSQQDFGKAMNSYKKALRLNPQDQEARYNLAYSRRMLQEQQQQEQNKEQDKEQEEDQQEQEENQDQEGEEDKEQEQENKEKEGNKDQEGEDGEQDQEGENQQEQDKEQEEGEQKEQEGKQGEEGEQGEQGEQDQMQIDPNSISPEDAARILEALDKAEEDLQGKLRKHKKGKGKKIEKDW